jgi:UDP-glucose 4-epimerase
MPDRMRALVTGGAGFIGSHLVDAMLERGDTVAVVDDLSTGRREQIPDGVRLHVLDIAEIAWVMADERPDVVFHLAAQVDVRHSVSDPARDARVNVAGTATVLEAARRAGVRRVVLASTAGVYGDAAPTARPAWWRSSPARPPPAVRSRCTATAARRATTSTSATWRARSWRPPTRTPPAS